MRICKSVFGIALAHPIYVGVYVVFLSLLGIFLTGGSTYVDTAGTTYVAEPANLEVVDRDGVFAGGIIAPGVETSASALFSHANRLSAIELEDPRTAIGGNTAQAIQAGIVYGEADRVDGLVRRVFEQLGYEAPVVATGGLASLIAPLSRTITHVNKELTLEGLRRIYETRG